MFHPDFYDPAKAAVVDRVGGFLVSGHPYNGIVLPGHGVPKAAAVPAAVGNNTQAAPRRIV